LPLLAAKVMTGLMTLYLGRNKTNMKKYYVYLFEIRRSNHVGYNTLEDALKESLAGDNVEMLTAFVDYSDKHEYHKIFITKPLEFKKEILELQCVYNLEVANEQFALNVYEKLHETLNDIVGHTLWEVRL
jgi:hypothetical protein